jgi:FAD synthetase
MKKVIVFGTFDILHKGHIHFFNQARKHGDYLIIVIARDKTVRKLKRIPHHNEKQRLRAVKKYADKAVLGNLKDKYAVIRKFKPDIICLGYDQKFFLDGLNQFKIPLKKLTSYKPHIYKSAKLIKKLAR